MKNGFKKIAHKPVRVCFKKEEEQERLLTKFLGSNCTEEIISVHSNDYVKLLRANVFGKGESIVFYYFYM